MRVLIDRIDLPDLLAQPARWASVLRWATIAGMELGAIGPFGSYKGNIFFRLAYWTILFWCGGLTLWPSVTAALALGPQRGWPPMFAGTAATLAACVPLAGLSAAGCYLLWPVHASGIRALEWYGMTTLVVLPATVALVWLELSDRRMPSRATDRAAAAQDGGGLPDHLADGALCLQMEDHFVRVHLPGRSQLHGATLARAMRGLADRRGIQVHRSWWVAPEAVAGWTRDGRTVSLLLANGLVVPVARQRVAQLRAAGWLDEARQIAPSNQPAPA